MNITDNTATACIERMRFVSEIREMDNETVFNLNDEMHEEIVQLIENGEVKKAIEVQRRLKLLNEELLFRLRRELK